MFRNISIILVSALFIFACDNNKFEHNTSKKFDTKDFYKENQNTRVTQFFIDSEMLRKGTNQEFFFVNKSGCDACVNNKYDELIEILKLTNINSVVIINDSSYIKNVKNNFVSFKYFSTEILKSKEIFHSTPWLYSSSNGKLVDKKLTSPVCDSLLNRFH